MLFNKLKDLAEDLICLFSKEKNFDQDQNVTNMNDSCLYADTYEVQSIMHTQIPATLIVLVVVSKERQLLKIIVKL